jgi:hypothetical protein
MLFDLYPHDIKKNRMHLVVDSDWAKAHPRRAAKIQVEYLLWLARRRNRRCSAEVGTTGEGAVRKGRRAIGSSR